MKNVFLSMMALAAVANPNSGGTPEVNAGNADSLMDTLEEEVAGELGITKEELEKEMAQAEEQDGDDLPLPGDPEVEAEGEGIVDNTDDATNPDAGTLGAILSGDC